MESLFAAARIGLSIGTQYAMVSIGFTLIFGIMGVINFAHGSGDVLGGYFAYVAAGMLGLLMVLAARPRFLLLDEPAAGLERRERTHIDRFLAHAREKLDCGVLIVENDMDLVKRLCPHIVVLESGRILAKGAPAEVLTRREVMDAYLGASEED